MIRGYVYSERLVTIVFLTTATVMACGCSRHPTVVPVRGTVTLDGRPLTTGRVMFEPVAGGDAQLSGQAAFANIDPDGSFALTTFGDNDGAIVGSYHPSVMGPRQDEDETPIPGALAGVVRLQSVTFQVQADAENLFHIQLDSRSPEFQQSVADD